MNIIPVDTDDSKLKRAAKGVVNLGIGGPLSIASNTIRTALDAPLSNLAKNVSGVVQGEGLQGYDTELTPGKIANEAGITGIAGTAADMLLSPSTYFAGGLVDDAARAGMIGKSAMKGTTENLINIATRNQNVLKKLKAGIKAYPCRS